MFEGHSSRAELESLGAGQRGGQDLGKGCRHHPGVSHCSWGGDSTPDSTAGGSMRQGNLLGHWEGLELGRAGFSRSEGFRKG